MASILRAQLSACAPWQHPLLPAAYHPVAPCCVPEQARVAHVATRLRAGAVMERTIEEVQNPEVVVEQQPAETWEGFEERLAEYKSATVQLDSLESLKRELMNSVASADSVLMPPTPPADAKAKEARRAKRQQSRAARSRGLSAPTAADTPVNASPAAQSDTSTSSLALNQPSTVPQQPPLSQDAVLRRPLPSATPAAPQEAHAAPSTSRSRAPPQPSTAALQLRPAPGGLACLSPPASSTSTAASKSAVRAGRYTRGRSSTAAPSQGAAAVSRTGSEAGKDATATFMKKLSNTSLLTHDEQKVLANAVKEFLTLQRMEAQLKSILKRQPTLTEFAKAAKMEELELKLRMKQGRDAKARMLKSNYRLVVSVVKGYQGRGLSLQDLITEGMNGLLRGVEKFEADKGFKFSTYAHWWIRQAVSRALQDQLRAVRLPSHIQEQLAKIKQARSQLSKNLGRQPELHEIAEMTGIPEDKIPEILAAANQPKSLEQPMLDSDGASELKDMIADDRAAPDEAFDDSMLAKNLEEVLRSLPEREAEVLRMHWGLNGRSECTLEDIGAHFNITRERVRQLEARALQRLKEKRHQLASGIMGELELAPTVESTGTAYRSSRGTKKT